VLTWLAAAVAFSLSMILFSTIVSALTEFVHRLFHMREIGLRRMLEELYKQHLAPQLLPARTSTDGKAETFSDQLTRNLAFGVKPRGVLAVFGYWFAPRRLQSLDWLEFVRRVAETDVGRELAKQAKPEIDRIVDEIAVRFERFGADASAYFQERARAISITLAMVVAFVVNVDAARLFSTFVSDRQLTEQVLSRADQIIAQLKARDEAAPPDVTDAARRLKATADSQLLAGLPIGYEIYPYCTAKGDGQHDERCAKGFEFLTALTWLLSVLAAGFLIGLGGPFWFQVYTQLAAVLAAARGGKSDDATKDEGAVPSPDRVPPPAMHVAPAAAFIAALPPARPPGRRLLLARDGRPLR